jgi:hypothetical protein
MKSEEQKSVNAVTVNPPTFKNPDDQVKTITLLTVLYVCKIRSLTLWKDHNYRCLKKCSQENVQIKKINWAIRALNNEEFNELYRSHSSGKTRNVVHRILTGKSLEKCPFKRRRRWAGNTKRNS